MDALTRDRRRLLAEIAMAAAGQRLQDEARAMQSSLDLLIADAEARDLCSFCIFTQLGDRASAQASLGQHHHPAALALLAISNSSHPHSRTARLIR
ncbi:DUF1039 domain-containing protein [Cupriavidus pampae]|uniref:DUF1039 domain-containing protein n=1 Tax=Cupriavidus pampae TaxID=659251 RepID=UPI001CC3C84F|nr:DUF1039 domain-containing protein [Cupriavidus pampae]